MSNDENHVLPHIHSDSDNESFVEEDFVDQIYHDELHRYVGFSQYAEYSYPRLPRRTKKFTGGEKVEEILCGQEERCYDLFRLTTNGVHMLNYELTTRGCLTCHQFVGTEEQICIFLYTVAHALPNRVVSEEFQHSDEIISRHFHGVLRALVDILKQDYIQLPPADVGCHPVIERDSRFFPFFEDALGAIDGTYIPAIVKKTKHNRYRCSRHGFIAQNVMAVVSFDEQFLFVVSGVEGSASDRKVLRMCLENKSFSVPEGKYYLVDGEYAITESFMPPYSGYRCHLKDFKGQEGQPYRDPRDKFNHRHTQLHNCVKRVLAQLKLRFKILRCPLPFKFTIQADIVVACCVLHNFIKRYDNDDLSTSGSKVEHEDVVGDPLWHDAILEIMQALWSNPV